MTAEALLKDSVNWVEEFVGQVSFEVVDEDGHKSVETYEMDEEVSTDKGFAYFYALGEEEFYWGHLADGEYSTINYINRLFDLMEYEDIDDKWLATNPKRVGPIVTDNIIADKSMFQTFQYLMSYDQIYAAFPLIDCLRDYLTEYYETVIEATFPEEVENAKVRAAFNK